MTTAMEDAQVFLAMAAAIDLPEPKMSVSDGGDVWLLWGRGGSKRAEVLFDGSGTYGYAMFFDEKYHPGREGGPLIGAELPQELVDYIRDMR